MTAIRGIRKKLPIGIDNFEKIRKNNFYYIDKTGLIIDLLNNWGEVTLFTRPRRFGKSLNMSMLASFFSPDSDKSIFRGLMIEQEKDLCEEYMGKYPVISVSLKSINAANYEMAYNMAADIVREAAMQVDEQIPDKSRLHPVDRADLQRLLHEHMEDSVLYGSIYTLSRILKRYYGQNVIILIDEYDVPLAKAYEQGYYEQMVLLIRNIFEKALKTNSNLQFAVLSGCMRISKESIFTGLNNLEVRSISDVEYDEYFGFTDGEVRAMLEYYGFAYAYDAVKEWYDGYQFGNTLIYCPWDVICYCKKLITDGNGTPENFWLNSSGNNIVRKFVEHSRNATLRDELESLINGETIEKTIRQDLTYPEMYSSIDNLWSVLYTTGYLTQRGTGNGMGLRLAIPNQEIHNIFTEHILEMFTRDVQKDGVALGRFCDALQSGDVFSAEQGLCDYLKRTISVRDTCVRTSLKESFYHGLLLGILGTRDSWSVTSNREAGDGFSDIEIRDAERKLAIVIEVKYADDGRLDSVCRKALQQIQEKDYVGKFYRDEYERVLIYGIACCRKDCRVMAG